MLAGPYRLLYKYVEDGEKRRRIGREEEKKEKRWRVYFKDTNK